MTRVAVIAASNLGYRNPGMITVDLGFDSVMRRLGGGQDIQTSWYTLTPPQTRPILKHAQDAGLPFSFKPLIGSMDEVFEHDAIVLWGDFLQALHYIKAGAPKLVKDGRAETVDDAIELTMRSLLIKGAPREVFDKLFVFGSTILHNRQADYSFIPYRDALVTLVRSCRGIWMREPISAAKVMHLRQTYGSSHLGVDAALLLAEEDAARLPTTDWSSAIPHKKNVGVFWGKRTRLPRSFTSFCTKLAARLDAEVEWLPWLPSSEDDRPPKRLADGVAVTRWLDTLAMRRTMKLFDRRGRDHKFGDLLAALRKYKFIITDTYHACVNAWMVGTPAVCLGIAQPQVDSGSPVGLAVNDLKKHVLYMMYDATDFYLTTDAVSTPRATEMTIDRLVELLRNEKLCSSVVERMRAHADAVDEEFRMCLSQVLGIDSVRC